MSAQPCSSGKARPGAEGSSFSLRRSSPYSVAFSASSAAAPPWAGAPGPSAAPPGPAAASVLSASPLAPAASAAPLPEPFPARAASRFCLLSALVSFGFLPPARPLFVAPPPSPRSPPSTDMKNSVPAEERYSRMRTRSPSAPSGQSRTSRQRMQRQLFPARFSSAKTACLRFVLELPAMMETSGMSRMTRLSRIHGCTSAFTRAKRSMSCFGSRSVYGM
mmetsp:Transcript_11157/g.33616  ORF Transcript_11157/g.33616 Transcript_11157/m.33616 type:complete len:220 (-) Transcript_11157:478-1137(-)